MTQRTINTKFWTETQNNSGGVFDHDPEKGIGYAICVESIDKDDAVRRMQAIVDSYDASGDCPCCGPRWSIYQYDDGTDEPELYGAPIGGARGIPSYVHRLDGRIDAVPGPAKA